MSDFLPGESKSGGQVFPLASYKWLLGREHATRQEERPDLHRGAHRGTFISGSSFPMTSYSCRSVRSVSGNGEAAYSNCCSKAALWYWWSNPEKVCKDCGNGFLSLGGRFSPR